MRLFRFLILLGVWPFYLEGQTIKPAIQHGHFDDITRLELDESRRVLNSFSKNNQQVTWDLKTGMMVASEAASASVQGNDSETFRKDSIVLKDTTYRILGAMLQKVIKGEITHTRTTSYYDLGFSTVHVQPANPYVFAASFDGKIYVYDKRNLKLITHLKDHNDGVLCLTMSQDGNLLYSSGKDRSIIEWDARKLSLKRRFFGHSQRLTALAFSSTGDSLYFGNELGQLKMFSFTGYSGALEVKPISNYEITNLQLRPTRKSQELIITAHDNRIHSYDIHRHDQSTLLKYHQLSLRHTKHFIVERILNRFTHPGIDLFATDYNAGSNSIALGANEVFNRKRRKVVVKDFDKGRRKVIRSDYERFKDISVINDTLIAVHREDGVDPMSAHDDAELTLWKIKGRKFSHYNTPFKFVLDVEAHKGHFLYVATVQGLHLWDIASNKSEQFATRQFNKLKIQGEYLAAISGNSAEIFKIAADGRLTTFFTLNGHSEAITDIAISEKRGIIATSSNDASIRFYAMDGKHLAMLVPTGHQDFILLSPDNAYQITKNSYKKFGFASGDNFIFPDQFDLIFNKPHEVLSALNIGSREENMLLERAYEKRIRRMGMDELALGEFNNLPEISIMNYSPSGDTALTIQLKAEDSDYPLDRINVYVNDVAVHGTKGLDLSGQHIQQWEGNLTVPLLDGTNKVEVSLLNANGVESLRQSLRYDATIAAKPALYLIAFGASKYQDSHFNLTYAEKDARDVATLFEKNNTQHYSAVYTHVLVNEQVNRESLEGCKAFLAQARPGDAVIIFFAGHGVLDRKLDYYLASYDIDFTNPQQQGIPYDEMEALLDGIKPLRKALLIDACHSGELDKEDVLAYQVEARDENAEGIVFRTVGTAVKENSLGVKKTNEMVREVFTDLRKGTGATVISSAGGMEFAQESGQWKNGLFTYCLLEGITSRSTDLNRDGTIMLSELQKYVSARVFKLSKGLQQPTSRIENDALDWEVW